MTTMKPWHKRLLIAVASLSLLAAGRLLGVAWQQADKLLTNPLATRRLPQRSPADFGLPYREISLLSADGLRLVAWYVPGRNGALVIAQHGYKSQRGEMLQQAAILARHGYGVLLPALRSHDRSEGELITFGLKEVDDLEAWFRYGQHLPGVAADRVGLLGNSLGGVLAIELAARNPSVKAVVAHSAFSSLTDTIDISVTHYTGLRPFPFASLIRFWAEQRLGMSIAAVDAKRWIGRISPRPVLILQGGADSNIAVNSGALLYAAAGEPKTLWYEPALGHVAFDQDLPAVYERRVVAFFDCYLATGNTNPACQQAGQR